MRALIRTAVRALSARFARVALALVLLAVVAGCGGGPRNDSVTILVPWKGAEFDAFYGIVKRFHDRTGIDVDVEVTRALNQQLDAAVKAGDPPDLAVLSSPGLIDQYASGKKLQQLDVDSAVYPEPFRGLTTVGGRVYAVPVKADVKSLIWYDPAVLRNPPTAALPALEALSATRGDLWCLGLESGPTSGWPGADWIADVLLARHGPDAYEKWLTGGAQWSSQWIRDAWTEWVNLMRGSTAQASVTTSGDAALGMTAAPPGCLLDHGALAAMGFGPKLRQGRDYAYVKPSTATPLEVSADFVGMFTAHNPSALKFITYLSGTEAQTAWVKATGGFAISADSRVGLGAYPPGVQRSIASLLRPDSGYRLCFSAADTMEPDLSAAFYRAVLDFVNAPGTLTRLLGGLDKIQKAAGSSPVPGGKICSGVH